MLYGFVGEKKRDFQAHFDGKVKAVCAYFGSKLEGIQTENAQLLELVKKYKSTTTCSVDRNLSVTTAVST